LSRARSAAGRFRAPVRGIGLALHDVRGGLQMGKNVVAGESMSGSLVMIDQDEGMKTAYERMHKHRIRHLPVKNDQGEIIGMLSDRDVQRAMISEIRHEGSSEKFTSETIKFDPDARVRDYMSWPVLTIERETDLCAVADRMLREKVSAFLVQSEGRTVGIITTDDLLKVLVDLLADPKTPARWTLTELLAEGARYAASVGL
jgi:CBS domain-containing protein